MSKIEKHITTALEVKPKRGEERQDFLNRALKTIADLSDKEWDELPKDVQDWFNAAADAKNSKSKELPDFPDLEKEEDDEPKTTRRSAKSDDDEPSGKTTGTVEVKKAKVGMALKVTTKRGKELSGHVVEVDSEVLVLKLGNGDEEELDLSRIEKMETLAESADKDDDAGHPDPIQVGAEVVLTTKRGKEVTGKIVEIDAEIVVLDTGDGEEEFSRERVEKIEAKGGKAKSTRTAAKDDDEPKSSRRSAKAKDDDAGDGTPEPAKRTRSTNEGGVSVGTRIKELIAEDLEATKDDIAKILKKEGLEFRENTLSINYTDCHRFLEILKKAKRLK